MQFPLEEEDEEEAEEEEVVFGGLWGGLKDLERFRLLPLLPPPPPPPPAWLAVTE